MTKGRNNETETVATGHLKPGVYFFRVPDRKEWEVVTVYGPDNFGRTQYVMFFGGEVLPIEKVKGEWGLKIEMPKNIACSP